MGRPLDFGDHLQHSRDISDVVTRSSDPQYYRRPISDVGTHSSGLQYRQSISDVGTHSSGLQRLEQFISDFRTHSSSLQYRQPISNVGTHSNGLGYEQPISDIETHSSGFGYGQPISNVGLGWGNAASFEGHNRYQIFSYSAIGNERIINEGGSVIWEQIMSEFYSHGSRVSGSVVEENRNYQHHETTSTTSTSSSYRDIDTRGRGFRPFLAINLPEDEVALMDSSAYEFLRVPREPFGRVSTSLLSEETIASHLNTRTHVSSANQDEEPDMCVICQAEYEKNETIGRLECGHEYHAECIKTWLLENNVCPICKATALSI